MLAACCVQHLQLHFALLHAEILPLAWSVGMAEGPGNHGCSPWLWMQPLATCPI